MKTIYIFILAICSSLNLIAQTSNGHIKTIVNDNEVIISLGINDVNINDILEVRGKAEIKHPNSDQTIIRDNILLGLIKITEVMSESSKCELVLKKHPIRELSYVNTLSDITQIQENYSNEPESYPTGEYTVAQNIITKTKKPKPFKFNKIETQNNKIIGTLDSLPKNFKPKNKYVIVSDNEVVGTFKYQQSFTEKQSGVIEIKESHKQVLSDIEKNNSIKQYKPIYFSLGVHSYLYEFDAIMFGLNLGIDWYPNKNISKTQKYNNLFWLGANLNIDKFPKSESFDDYEYKSINIATSVEIGFSPWASLNGRNLFFGVIQKFQKNIPLDSSYAEETNYNYYTGETIIEVKEHRNALLQHLPHVFIGYEYRKLSARIVAGPYKYYFYRNWTGDELIDKEAIWINFGIEIEYSF